MPLSIQFPELFHCAQNRRVVVSDYVARMGSEVVWGPIFRGNLSKMNEVQFCSLSVLINKVYNMMDGSDSRLWSCLTDRSVTKAVDQSPNHIASL